MSLKLAVFDWNGTLFDDTHFIVEALNLGEVPLLGIPPLTVEKYSEFYDVPIRFMYEKLGVPLEEFDALSKELSKGFHHYYEPLALKAKSREGSKSLLSSLDENGVKCVILSNHTIVSIEIQLKRLNLEQYFDKILANEVIGAAHHKGKQSRLEEYLDEQSIDASDVVIIGDTLEETRIANSLELKSIAVTGGVCTIERLEAVKPNYIAHSLKEVQKIMEEMI